MSDTTKKPARKRAAKKAAKKVAAKVVTPAAEVVAAPKETPKETAPTKVDAVVEWLDAVGVDVGTKTIERVRNAYASGKLIACYTGDNGPALVLEDADAADRDARRAVGAKHNHVKFLVK